MKKCFTIAEKELKGFFRDKFTFVILLIPMLIFPIFNYGINYLNKTSQTKMNICIETDNQNVYNILLDFISSDGQYNINIIDTDSPRDLLLNGKVDFIISADNESINLIYNSSSYDSLSQAMKFGETFQQFYVLQINESYEDIYQLNLKDEDNNSEDSAKSISKMVVPVILIMIAFQGTTSFANDIFAGEKERKTLGLLFMSGVKRSHIYFGKSIALAVLAIINLLLSFVSYYISFFGTSIQQFKFAQSGNIMLNIMCMMGALLLLAIITAILSSSISMFSKNMKNSQVMNELLLIIPTGIGALLSFGLINHNIIVYRFIPVLNLMIDFIDAFNGRICLPYIVISVVTNSIFIIALAFASIKYINSEKMTV